ncbi:MAG: hypothetical protein JNL83_08485 [Myxococcales bacterium]|nr:hypothetical protein [Myxococcales bacterium]
MRTTLYTAALLALAAAPACKWTEFDDLEGDTWVTATDKPNGDSTDYGVAIARGQRGSNGGKLVVLGSGQAQFTELVYSPNGDADLAPTAQKLNSQFGIGNLDIQPILLADPTSDEVSLVVNSGGQSIAVLTGAGGLLAHQVFGPEQPDSATYMLPPPNATQPTPPVQVLVAASDVVYGAFVSNTPNPQPKCNIVDDAAAALDVKGLGATRLAPSTTDDVVVWGVPKAGGMGKLSVYPGSVFAGCAAPQAPLTGWATATTPFAPSKGSQLIMVDATHVLAVGHKDLGNPESFLGLYRLDPTAKTITMIGAPVTVPDLRTAAIYDDGSKKYVVAGYPTAIIDGTKSGQVAIYTLDLTSGIGTSPSAVLHDAQPEEEQQFGRAVAVTPFNGKPVIAVAADNEIFMYFRLDPLYAETRTGR